MRKLVIALAAVLTVAVIWCCVAPREMPRFAAPAEEPAAIARVLAELDARDVPDASAMRTVVAEPVVPAVPAELDDAALLEALRAAGSAWNARDEKALTSRLETLLSSPRTPRRVLTLLEEARLPRASLEEQGAILAIGFGLAHASHTGALALDGRPLARDVLESLARMEREPGVGVAQFASRLKVGTELAVGARWITKIVSLREHFPEHAENFEPFLRAILDGSAPIDIPVDDLPALALVVASSNDPLAVETALAALVASDPEVFIPIAEDLYAHSAANAALRAAAVSAVAARAPVGAAAESLARMAGSELYGEFARLGARNGGLDAAQGKYSALVAANANSQARKMLVSAMAGEKTDVLVGIAQTDPDAVVRQQALLTASLRPLESEMVMQTVRDQLSAHDGAGRGFSTHDGLMVAQNVLVNGTGTARAGAVALLRQVVTDPRESMLDRQAAWSQLRETGVPGDVAGLEEPH